MTIKSTLLVIIWMIIIPIIMGYGLLTIKNILGDLINKLFKNKENNKNDEIVIQDDGKGKIFFAWILGFFIQWTVFQILSVPFAYYHTSFTYLKNIWSYITYSFVFVSLIINVKKFKTIFQDNIQGLKEIPKLLGTVALLSVGLQCFFAYYYTFYDADDSNFAAKATIAVDTDSLFIYDDIGNEYKELPKRQFFSQFPHYGGVVASLCDLRPTILLHTYYPLIFIPLAYSMYYLIGLSLFNHKKDDAILFVLMVSMVYWFGNYSRYAPFIRLVTRTWQGKSLMVNIALPFLWYLYLEFLGKKKDIFYWFALMLTLWGGCLLTSNSLYMLPLSAGILAIICMFANKKISLAGKYILSVIPTCCYLLAYVIMFGGTK